MNDWSPPKGTKITKPLIDINHPDYKFKPGADVQSTWRKHGWVPPSEGRPAPPPEKPAFEQPLKPLRVVRNK